MSTRNAFHAVTRFGLGPRPGELEVASRGPRGWLLAQVESGRIPNGPVPMDEGLELTRGMLNPGSVDIKKTRARMRAFFVEQVIVRFRHMTASREPFAERLVVFWSNHFTISATNPRTMGLMAHFEAEAIRPHVCGKFGDMLLAVVRHPAMLEYLDNRNSFGPNSFHGRWKNSGLNENLAREVLELHTLGVDGGYRQADVEALAKILTGWSLRLDPYSRNLLPRFGFQQSVHEPGSKVLLGREFRERGEDEGIAALRMLAKHPATARHVATKLAIHFISDRPSRATVNRLASTFRSTGGDLSALYRILVGLSDSWANPLAKIKNPHDYLLSIYRALDRVPEPKPLPHWLATLDYRIHRAASPAGHPDTNADWMGPAAVLGRIDLAKRIARMLGGNHDPSLLARRTIGPVMSERTAFAIDNAPSKQEGLALLLASPEFQRR